MYAIVLSLHNIVRWVVLFFAVLALILNYSGWLVRRRWTSLDRLSGVFFTSSLDIQILLGLILYVFLSPLTKAFFGNLSVAITNPELRFFGLTHLLLMVLAAAIAHMGSAISRRARDPWKKHRTAAIFFTIVILIIVLAIPWSRPLIRLG